MSDFISNCSIEIHIPQLLFWIQIIPGGIFTFMWKASQKSAAAANQHVDYSV